MMNTSVWVEETAYCDWDWSICLDCLHTKLIYIGWRLK